MSRLQGKSAGGFLKRIFGGKGNAQLRGFVLFCDIAPFLEVPDPSRMGGLSRRIQERLRAVGESFGTNFPVYVVFTKSDTIPYFSEYFARLVENEDQQVLGCTLPAVAPGARPAGEVFAEAETARLSEYLNELYYSLADKRLSLLPREMNAPQRPAVYEFPREMKRIRDTLVQFLVDVFRPNPLQPGPILRGIYFTGTRQVTVSALGPVWPNRRPVRPWAKQHHYSTSPITKKGGAGGGDAGDAHRNQRAALVLRGRAVPSRDPARSHGTGRRLRQPPDRHIPADRLCGRRRTRLDSMRALDPLLVEQRGPVEDTRKAAQAPYSFQTNQRTAPSLEALKGIEELRERLETLLDYDRNGAPWRMRWGLYAGTDALPSVYDLYFQRFRQLFFDDMQSSISGTLLRLPGSPDAQNSYNATYDRVKAYRMITQGKCSPDPAFLSPVLANTWLANRSIDPERQVLASKQISFYAAELKHRNPYKLAENNDAIERGRMYLSAFGGVERLYRGIVEEANKAPHRPARLADLAGNYKQVLNTPGEVQAAFTREGSNFVLSAIKDPSRLTIGEPCVLGGVNAGAQLLQGAQVQTDLQNAYVQDYIRRWKEFAAATNVDSFRSPADAGKKLELLADNRSPLLAAVFMIADNTNFAAASSAAPAAASGLLDKFMPAGAKKAVDAAKQAVGGAQAATPADIGKVFQPAREVVVVADRDRLINDPNRSYMNALSDLQRAMQRLQDERPANPDMALHEQARKATDAGLDSVRQIAGKFNIANSQGVDSDLKRLLEAPFRESLKYIVTDPAKAGREGAAGALRKFCGRLAPVQKKFPFNPASDADASAEEMASLFGPQGSALADMQQQTSKIVVKQGKQWAANPASQDVHPTPEFLAFLNKMQQVQDALFGDGSTQMKAKYSLKPMPEQNVEAVTLNIDGQQSTSTRSSAQAQQFSWPGSGQVVVSVRAGGNIPFGSYSGPWSVWRWMYDADPRPAGSKVAQWSMLRAGRGQPQQPTDAQGKPIVLRVEIAEFPGGVDIFDKNFFVIRCPAKVAE